MNLVERRFSLAARSYDRSALFQKTCACDFAEFFHPFLSGGRILDAACGTGFLTGEIVRMFPAAEITVSDVSREMLEVCSQKFPNVRPVRHDFNFPFPETGFDAVVSSLGLQWCGDRIKTFSAIRSVLKEHGVFCAALPLKGSLEELRKIFRDAGCEFPGIALPEAAELERIFTTLFRETHFEKVRYAECYDNIRELLKSMKLNGTSSGTGATPLSVLRKIIEDHRRPMQVGYEVLFAAGLR